jgi:hypothetical protein
VQTISLSELVNRFSHFPLTRFDRLLSILLDLVTAFITANKRRYTTWFGAASPAAHFNLLCEIL